MNKLCNAISSKASTLMIIGEGLLAKSNNSIEISGHLTP
jgi:hypothetical protein